MQTISCKKCGHTWVPRTDNPLQCPHCHSNSWNKDIKRRNREV